MALINCPECGKDISDKAKSCPSCGYVLISAYEEGIKDKTPPHKSFKKLWIIAIASVCLVGIAIWCIFFRGTSLEIRAKKCVGLLKKTEKNIKIHDILIFKRSGHGKSKYYGWESAPKGLKDDEWYFTLIVYSNSSSYSERFACYDNNYEYIGSGDDGEYDIWVLSFISEYYDVKSNNKSQVEPGKNWGNNEIDYVVTEKEAKEYEHCIIRIDPSQIE